MASREEWFAAGWFGATLMMALHIGGQVLLGWDTGHPTYWVALGFLLVNAAATGADYHGLI